MTKTEAQKDVPTHVYPKECFVTYKGTKEGWARIIGTGCAHYVAHQLGVRSGLRCDAGYTVRVPDLVCSMARVDAANVAANDVWANARLKHTGMVVEVTEAGGKRTIIIEHCSSEQGGVVRNEWAVHFGSGGQFYRPASVSASATPPARYRTSGFPVREVFS